MSKFSKGKKKKGPAISTASLPDIVFMLLFFFMVTSIPKKNTPQLIINMPKADQAMELKKNAKEMVFWIGLEDEGASAYRVQIDDRVIPEIGFISAYLIDKKMDPEWAQEWMSNVRSNFKIDEEADMRTVTKVQEILRDYDALKVSYETKKK